MLSCGERGRAEGVSLLEKSPPPPFFSVVARLDPTNSVWNAIYEIQLIPVHKMVKVCIEQWASLLFCRYSSTSGGYTGYDEMSSSCSSARLG